ncbi:MAG: lipocalin family protein [Planctomycetota bacterium]
MTRCLRVLLLLATSVVFTSCGASEPVGVWVIDVDRTLEKNPDMLPSDASAEDRQRVREFIGQMMTMTLESGGAATMEVELFGTLRKDSAKWSLSGDQITIESDDGDSKKVDSATIDGDSIVMVAKSQNGEQTLYLKRK